MKVCISCQTDVNGKRSVPVKEDRIIRTIRSIKKTLRIAQMNELYVCEACLPKHMERRRSFEKTLLFTSILAGLLVLILVFAPALSGRIELFAIGSGIIIGLLILMFPLFKYTPAIESNSTSVANSSNTPPNMQLAKTVEGAKTKLKINAQEISKPKKKTKKV